MFQHPTGVNLAHRELFQHVVLRQQETLLLHVHHSARVQSTWKVLPFHGSINEPITTGISCQRTDSAAGKDDATILAPPRTKQLKVYAKKVTEENDVSAKGLNDFINVSCGTA